MELFLQLQPIFGIGEKLMVMNVSCWLYIKTESELYLLLSTNCVCFEPALNIYFIVKYSMVPWNRL